MVLGYKVAREQQISVLNLYVSVLFASIFKLRQVGDHRASQHCPSCRNIDRGDIALISSLHDGSKDRKYLNEGTEGRFDGFVPSESHQGCAHSSSNLPNFDFCQCHATFFGQPIVL